MAEHALRFPAVRVTRAALGDPHHRLGGAATPVALARAIHAQGLTHSAPPSAPASASAGAMATQTKPRALTPGTYDGRGTIASALGVALFALATRAMSFDAPPADVDCAQVLGPVRPARGVGLALPWASRNRRWKGRGKCGARSWCVSWRCGMS